MNAIKSLATSHAHISLAVGTVLLLSKQEHEAQAVKLIVVTFIFAAIMFYKCIRPDAAVSFEEPKAIPELYTSTVKQTSAATATYDESKPYDQSTSYEGNPMASSAQPGKEYTETKIGEERLTSSGTGESQAVAAAAGTGENAAQQEEGGGILNTIGNIIWGIIRIGFEIILA